MAHHFSYLDTEGTDRGKVERPWAILGQLKRAPPLAAEDIAEKHNYDTAAKRDSLLVLVALARLMDHHNPKIEDSNRLGKKLESAKLMGDEWQDGKYASAKNKLQVAIRKAALDDIQKEVQRLDQASEDAGKAGEDPAH